MLYDPVIPPLSRYPREMETYFHRKALTCMFLTALFIIAQTENFPDVCQHVNGSTSVIISNGEYHSAMKRNELLTHSTRLQGGISKACRAQAAKEKGVHTMRFSLYNTLRKGSRKLFVNSNKKWLPGLRSSRGRRQLSAVVGIFSIFIVVVRWVYT